MFWLVSFGQQGIDLSLWLKKKNTNNHGKLFVHSLALFWENNCDHFVLNISLLNYPQTRKFQARILSPKMSEKTPDSRRDNKDTEATTRTC